MISIKENQINMTKIKFKNLACFQIIRSFKNIFYQALLVFSFYTKKVKDENIFLHLIIQQLQFLITKINKNFDIHNQY